MPLNKGVGQTDTIFLKLLEACLEEVLMNLKCNDDADYLINKVRR